jgi:hypothetical protein
MQGKKTSYFLIVLFSLVVLSVPFYWLFRTESYYGLSWLEGRRLSGFSDLVHRGFFLSLKAFARGDVDEGMPVIREQLIQRKFQQDLEAVLSDQFPLRLTWIQAAKAHDRGIIHLAYMLTEDPAIPSDRTSGYYITHDRTALLVSPEPFRKSILEVIDQRIGNYQTLIDANPEINFYVYYIQRIQNVSAHPMDGMFANLERGQYYAYFFQHKPAALIVEKIDIHTFEDHLTYFYRTDHHWNMKGVFHAYEEIYRLLGQNYPEIPDLLPYEDYLTEKVIEFRGSLAQKAFSPISEPFTIVDYRLPPHEVYDNGTLTAYSNSADYLAGNYPKDPYYNHYEGEFGRDWALIEFVFPGNPNRNLLVLGNSYDNALIPLLAAHYHHTYDVDLRFYKNFSLSTFLAEHPVDDILVIGENSIVFGSERYQIAP